jgi:hypothetical protein
MEEAAPEGDEQILIISATLKKLRTIVKPAFDTLLFDCPEDLKPKYNGQDSYYQFPGGIRAHLVGAEMGHIEDIRGIHKVKLVVIDEAAFFGDEDDSYPLDYVIDNILNPMFLRTKSKPRIIMTTTPPEIPNHPVDKYIDAAELKGNLIRFDIYESDIPPEKIEEANRRCTSQDAWDREYLCKRVYDTQRLIVPEWNEKHIYTVSDTSPVTRFHDKYFSIDTGTTDKTVGLLGYYDFTKAALFIEDEIVREGRNWTTLDLAEEIKAKEIERWVNSLPVYRRIGDSDNQILLMDFSRLHGLPISATSKDSLNAMVNKVRLWANAGRLRIHARCKLLLQTIKGGIWNKKKDEFARSVILGHMDALAALVYLVRNVDEVHNPIPPDFNVNYANQYFDKSKATPGDAAQKIHRALIGSNPFMRRDS